MENNKVFKNQKNRKKLRKTKDLGRWDLVAQCTLLDLSGTSRTVHVAAAEGGVLLCGIAHGAVSVRLQLLINLCEECCGTAHLVHEFVLQF